MFKDIKEWVSKCITCTRFRKIPQKQLAEAVVPVDAECWAEVMINFEGPCHPLDKDGNKYTMTYVCTVCLAAIFERAKIANSSDARKCFSNCIFRSGRLPDLVRHDRGSQFKTC